MSSKATRWLTGSETELLAHVNAKYLDKFIEMGIPILKRFKSGFLAEMGDIEVCLLIHIESDGNFKTQVCHIDENGQLKDRITANGINATQLVKSFIMDFPDATLTTSSRKPLCLFASSSSAFTTHETKTLDKQESQPQSQSRSLGTFQGYMNFTTFQSIIQDHSKTVSVAVP